VAFSSTAASFTLDRGDITNAAQQFSLGDTFTLHTTQNELAALGQQWTQLRSVDNGGLIQFGQNIPASSTEWIIKGPGLAGTDEIVVGIRRFWSTSPAGLAYWELAGLRGYAGGLTYNEQPGILPAASRPNLTQWSGELPYWISVTGRKITIKIRNNTYYMDAYLGLGIPWGSPKYQPYFLCVGGSAGAGETNWTSLSVSNSNYWGARAETAATSPLQVLNRSGSWQGYRARANNSRLDAWYGGGWVNSGEPNLWPFRGNGMAGVRGNLDGSSPLLPITCLPDLGEIEGLFAVSGSGNVQPEDIIWQPLSGKKYVVGTNTYRNSPEDFAALELT
jgi:hypothetical protein